MDELLLFAKAELKGILIFDIVNFVEANLAKFLLKIILQSSCLPYSTTKFVLSGEFSYTKV